MKTEILLIRHGQTAWNREGRGQGQVDIPLNEEGVLQAKLLALQLKKKHPEISALYSSDLERAHKTAQETAAVFDLPIILHPALREMNYGAAEGMLFEERLLRFGALEKALDEKYPKRQERWNYTAIKDAETYNQVHARILKQILEIAQKHRGEKVAIFSHGRAIRLLIQACTRCGEQACALDNCSIAHFHYDPHHAEPLQYLAVQSLIH